MRRTLPFCSYRIVVALVSKGAYAEVMPENRIKDLCNLSRCRRRHRVIPAISHKRGCASTRRGNNPSNIKRFVSNGKLVAEHPNFRKIVAFCITTLALRFKRNPFVPR